MISSGCALHGPRDRDVEMVRLIRAAATSLGSLITLYLSGYAVLALLRALVTEQGAEATFSVIESELPFASAMGAAVAFFLGLIFAPTRGDWRGLVGFGPAYVAVFLLLDRTELDPLDVPAMSFLIAMLALGTLSGVALAAMIWTRERRPIL
jgi:hypothetical protein